MSTSSIPILPMPSTSSSAPTTVVPVLSPLGTSTTPTFIPLLKPMETTPIIPVTSQPRMGHMTPLFKTPESMLSEAGEAVKRKILKGANSVMGAEGIDFSVLGSFLKEDCLEVKLASKGYVTTGKIIVREPNDLVTVHYLKALTSRGNMVFIKLDLHSEIELRPDDKCMLMKQSTSDAIHVPYDAKIHALDCSSLGPVCGVAFECEGDVCFLRKDESKENKMEEINFSWFNESAALVKGSPIARPIVLLSEIYKDPQCVADKVDEVYHKLVKIAYTSSNKKVDELGACIDTFHKSFHHLRDVRKCAMEKLHKNIMYLHGIRCKYEENMPCEPCEEEKYRKVVYNLRKRYDLYEDLLNMGLEACSITNGISELTCMLNKTSEHLECKVENLDHVWDGRHDNPGQGKWGHKSSDNPGHGNPY